MAILSSTSALDNELREKRTAPGCCDYTDSLDLGSAIECVTNDEEAKYDLEQLRFRRKTGYRILQEQGFAHVPEQGNSHFLP